mgnify:CR=1 FL=1
MTPDQDPSTLPQKNKSKDHCEARVFKFIAFAALVLLLYLINVLDPTFYGHVFHLVKGGDMEEAVCFLRSYGPWAIVISFFLDVFINAAGFLPPFSCLLPTEWCLACPLALPFPGRRSPWA